MPAAPLPAPAPPALAPQDALFRRPAPVVLALIVICCAVEAALLAADLGVIGTAQWRQRAYENGAFWAGLLQGWKPNYALQPGTMFVSYAFLHAGLLHLAGNMAALAVLGNLLGPRIGPAAFLLLWLLSAVLGALAFGLLSPSLQPMVGTSGALFGLTGLALAWEIRARRESRRSLWPVLGWVLGLAALNLVFWLIQHGMLAWEAHLGGFLAGLGWGFLRRAKPALPPDQPPDHPPDQPSGQPPVRARLAKRRS